MLVYPVGHGKLGRGEFVSPLAGADDGFVALINGCGIHVLRVCEAAVSPSFSAICDEISAAGVKDDP